MKSALHKEGNVTVQVSERLSGRGTIEIQTIGKDVETDSISLYPDNFTAMTLANIGKALIACAVKIEGRSVEPDVAGDNPPEHPDQHDEHLLGEQKVDA